MPKVEPVLSDKYANQRPKVHPPVVTTATLRKAKGLTLQAICDHMCEEHGIQTDRGTISAIENGHRGASARMLAAYADALGIPTTDIDTAYEPRKARRPRVVA
ncbi:helix-turn-helix domain-containing protein [Mycolicibacterium fortuitum]|uniref:helix-turn-helix domain-containing protein n=1 Tax=Mycolicibacterium fortuitum TaxID=1766 RepID=UPI001AEF596A|nr:helix-turn-helix transcriptional regulator [Mycolicibacterium fortuitum]MBP3086982.1 helix-turn-helix transcriptional regulator [Mycolicibacterium fortuitum]